MKFGVLSYDYCENLGDPVQSLAAEQFLPRVDERLYRELLNEYRSGTETAVLMNGWFSEFPANWPPSPAIRPIFVGFHVAEKAKALFAKPETVEYFKRHGPIGCRDRSTIDWLRSLGVEDTYYSKCLSLTFPRRSKAVRGGRPFFVDVSRMLLAGVPKSLKKRGVYTTHSCPLYLSDEEKFRAARKLLYLYRTHASLVVTTRLHCALPCAAMGIPVIFFGKPSVGRLEVLRDAGLPFYDQRKATLSLWQVGFAQAYLKRQVDWSPPPPDIEEEKKVIMEKTLQQIREKTGEEVVYTPFPFDGT